MADQHLIMAEHTLANWPTELYLPSAVVDRDNREAWLRMGGHDAAQRAATRSTGGSPRTASRRPIRLLIWSCARSSLPE